MKKILNFLLTLMLSHNYDEAIDGENSKGGSHKFNTIYDKISMQNNFCIIS